MKKGAIRSTAWFFALALSLTNITAGDLTGFAVNKGMRFYQQQPEGPPHPNANGIFVCELRVSGSRIMSAEVETPVRAVTLPESIATQAPFISEGRSTFASVQESAEALNENIGSGTFTFRIETDEGGAVSAELNLMGQDYPMAPNIELPPGFMYLEENSVNPTLVGPYDSQTDYRLRWEEWTGSQPGDFIQVGIFREGQGGTVAYHSPGYGEPGVIPGSATEHLIPGGTLAANAQFLLHVRFCRVETSSKIEGAVGVATFFSEVMFQIRTDTSDYGQPHDDTEPPRLLSAHSSEPDFQLWQPMSPSDYLEAFFAFSESLAIENSNHFVEWSPNVDSVEEVDTTLGGRRTVLHYVLRGYVPDTEITWKLHNIRDKAGNPLPEDQTSGVFRTGRREPFAVRYSDPILEDNYLTYRISAPIYEAVVIESSTDLQNWISISTNQVLEGEVALQLLTVDLPAQFLRARAIPNEEN